MKKTINLFLSNEKIISRMKKEEGREKNRDNQNSNDKKHFLASLLGCFLLTIRLSFCRIVDAKPKQRMRTRLHRNRQVALLQIRLHRNPKVVPL